MGIPDAGMRIPVEEDRAGGPATWYAFEIASSSDPVWQWNRVTWACRWSSPAMPEFQSRHGGAHCQDGGLPPPLHGCLQVLRLWVTWCAICHRHDCSPARLAHEGPAVRRFIEWIRI